MEKMMQNKIALAISMTALLCAAAQAASWSPVRTDVFLNWFDADNYCQKMSTSSQRWRLPTAAELITKYGSSSPKAPWAVNGSGIDWVWSSTNRSNEDHFLVNANNGSKSWPGDTRKAYVECVSGQSTDASAWLDEALNAMRMQQWVRAISIATPAANKNIPEATMILARLNFSGDGVPKDEKKGYELYLKAAKQGYALAQYSVAVIYETGRGTQIDLGQSLFWYKQAAAQGEQAAIDAVKRLQK